MSKRERRIDELHYEFTMLRTALDLFGDPPAQARIFARITSCIAEYTELIEGSLSTVDRPVERYRGNAAR
jgi:hypothetical protein